MTDGHSLFLPLIIIRPCCNVYSIREIVCPILLSDFKFDSSLLIHGFGLFKSRRDSRRPDERAQGKVLEPRGFISAQSTNQINTLCSFSTEQDEII